MNSHHPATLVCVAFHSADMEPTMQGRNVRRATEDGLELEFDDDFGTSARIRLRWFEHRFCRRSSDKRTLQAEFRCSSLLMPVSFWSGERTRPVVELAFRAKCGPNCAKVPNRHPNHFGSASGCQPSITITTRRTIGPRSPTDIRSPSEPNQQCC
jgi:hypothetical protein